jgi:hypothetical protein
MSDIYPSPISYSIAGRPIVDRGENDVLPNLRVHMLGYKSPFYSMSTITKPLTSEPVLHLN